MAFRLLSRETKIPFTSYRVAAFCVSTMLLVVALVAFFGLGLNFGIDFKGGATIEVGPAEGSTFVAEDLGRVRRAIEELDLGDAKIQEVGGGTDRAVAGIVIFLEAQHADQQFSDYCQAAAPQIQGDPLEIAQQIATACVKRKLVQTLGEGIKERRTDVVGPTVSDELVRAGVWAVAIAVALMLLYIWFRFEWQFSLGAILALVHDVVLTIGMFALTRLEFNLSIIAALLTIVGYSMNDTVVVYDRVRENLRKFKTLSLHQLLDLSVNQTLSRTLMTSLTTLLALSVLLIFGGAVLRGFTAAMIWGIFIGTYSSIFIAAPILMLTGVKRDWSKAATVQKPPD